MTRAGYQGQVQDDKGNVVPGVQISVVRLLAGLPKPQLYSAREGGISLGNPFAANSDGSFAFFVASGGAFKIIATAIVSDQLWTKEIPYVAIGTASEYDIESLQKRSLIVRAATTSNITIGTALNPGDTFQGLTLQAGDLILVKDKSDPKDNRIIEVSVSPAPPVSYQDWTPYIGLTVYVLEGDNEKKSYASDANAGGELGVTALKFAEIEFSIKDLEDGDVTESKVANHAITNVKAAQMAQGTIKGRAASSGTGDQQDLSASQAADIVRPHLALLPPEIALDADKQGLVVINEDGAILFESQPGKGFSVPGGHIQSSEEYPLAFLTGDGEILFAIRKDRSAMFAGNYGRTFITGLLLGAPTHDSIGVAFDLISGNNVVIELSTDAFFNSGKISSGIVVPDRLDKTDEGGEYYRQVNTTVGGLSASTRYYGRVVVDGDVKYAEQFTFKTLPAPGAAEEFCFIVGCCMDVKNGTDAKVFDAIADIVALEDALFFFQVGDFGYSDKLTTSLAAARRVDKRAVMQCQNFARLCRSLPVIYKWSDHDAAGNDNHWDKAYPGGVLNRDIITASLQAWRETVPFPPLAQFAIGEGDPAKLTMTYKFQVGRTLFISPDEYAQARYATGTPTCLGDGTNPGGGATWNQKQWLLDEIAAGDANPNVDRIVLVVGRLWYGDYFAGWQEFWQAEQTAIVDAFRNLAKPVFVVGGDPHYNAAYDTMTRPEFNVSTNGDVCYFGFVNGPLYHESVYGETARGDWRGANAKHIGEKSTFTKVVVDADGEIAFTFIAVDRATGVATEQATYSTKAFVPVVQFASSTKSGPASTPVALTLNKDWPGPVGGASVQWSTSNGQSGTVALGPNQRKKDFNVIAPAAGSITVTIAAPAGCTLGATTVLTLTAT